MLVAVVVLVRICVYVFACRMGEDFCEFYLANPGCPSRDEFIEDVRAAFREFAREYVGGGYRVDLEDFEIAGVIVEKLKRMGYVVFEPIAFVSFSGFSDKLEIWSRGALEESVREEALEDIWREYEERLRKLGLRAPRVSRCKCKGDVKGKNRD
ncbi:MAG: hypothetical protein B6U76_09535 [Desulfurococcales archaeon ex4484_217_2]|nr:MAG: hypothetical protein B6U76_09535 [Desulfurococcales archaeon ex4484_217_2]